MKTVSAVLVETGKPLELVELDIPALKAGQVLVEVMYSGVCHTQLLECRGHRGEDKYLPHCLGHEGSGIVRELGPGVKKVDAEDAVIMSWIKGSGIDAPGTVYRWNDADVNAGAITTFSRFAVVSENRLTRLPEGVPMRDAALLGCAVPTGVGTVCNTVNPKPGQSIVIFGCGGIGLCAIAGADLSGCWPIIAVDVLGSKLVIAEEMGATHCVNASKTDSLREIEILCPHGVDFAIEASGRTEVMSQALHCVRSQGGTAVVIGNARHGQHVHLDPFQLNLGKRLLGTWGGDSVPDRDTIRYANLIRTGKLNLEPMLSKTYSLSEINDALDSLEQGCCGRPMIEMTNGTQ